MTNFQKHVPGLMTRYSLCEALKVPFELGPFEPVQDEASCANAGVSKPAYSSTVPKSK